MPSHGHVDVRVLVDGQPLQEYLEPDDDNEDENDQVRYIQAEANQRFAVQVTFEAGYAIHYAPFLIDELYIDDVPGCRYHDTETRVLEKRKGILKLPSTTLHDGIPAKDTSGQWRRACYEFGALGLGENQANNAGLTPDRLQKQGTITVAVYRARQIPRAVPYSQPGNLPKTLDEVPEKLMKGRDVKTNTKYNLTTESMNRPAVQFYDYPPIEGSQGLKMKFIFKYRTKKALQNLGCIARSPSPEPDHDLIISRQDEMISQQKADIERLRRELERERQQSRERSATLGGDVAETGIRRGVKRGRLSEDNELIELAPPPKRPAVTIDLTEDE